MTKTVYQGIACLVAAFAASFVSAQTVVNIQGQGKAKKEVAIRVANRAFASSLKRNLELSGLFVVKPSASITVSGTPGAGVKAEGGGKLVTNADPVSDDRSARMAARRLSDLMCQAYGNQKGFACDRMMFRRFVKSGNTEVCMSYPDGFDAKQLTANGRPVLYMRWRNADTALYLDVNSNELIELNVNTGAHRPLLSGVKTQGFAVSPDGSKLAIIISSIRTDPKWKNPELCVVDIATKRFTRLTVTPTASEGQPAWSPDGREIVYVSDETRHPQLYVINVATKAKRRLTTRGSQNCEPDWGRDGRITYVSKRGGNCIAVMNPAEGEAGVRLVTKPGSWRHPSWARDGRHIVVSSSGNLLVLDSVEDGDEPRSIQLQGGKWEEPSWAK